MPNLDTDVEFPQEPDNQAFRHDKNILDYLKPTAEHCDFRSEGPVLAPYGLPVHPLRPRNKAPLLKGWQDKASTDPDQLEQWADKYPHANVGIVTGPESGIIILDFDLRNGALQSLADLQRKYGGDLPLSWDVLTPGGWHLYLRHPGGQVRNCQLAPGIDIRGDRANVVAPGSIHPNGLAYRWRPFCQPDVTSLANPPEWLLNLLKKKRYWMPEGEIRPEMFQVDLLGPLGFSAEGFWDSGVLTGQMVKALYSQEEVIQKCLPLLGLEGIEIGKKFKCILHEEARASASIMPARDPGDAYLYRDFHEREDRRRAFSLPFVYFRLKGGKDAEKVDRLPEPSFLVWSLRLLRDAGVISPVRVEGPRLPEEVSEEIERVYAGFQELLSLKYLIDANAPSPYTWGFIQAWTGLSKRMVEKAMRWLLSRGYIRFVSYFGDEGSDNKMMLFGLGTRELVRRRAALTLVKGRQSDVVQAVERDITAVLEQNEQKDAAAAAAKLCSKCGPVTDCYQFGETLVCKVCYGMLDTS